MLIPEIYLLICAVIGLAYGLSILFTKKPPLYFKLILFAMASQVFTRVFYLVTYLCYGDIPDVFNIGFVGLATFMMFLFFANFGSMDSLVDEKTKLITPYRILPLVIPVAEISISILVLFEDDVDFTVRISFVVLSAVAGLAGYFNLKHIIIRDVDGGIVRLVRGFNLLSLLVEILTLAEVALVCYGITNIVVYVQAVLGIIYIALLPLLYKEVRKWTQ